MSVEVGATVWYEGVQWRVTGRLECADPDGRPHVHLRLKRRLPMGGIELAWMDEERAAGSVRETDGELYGERRAMIGRDW